MTKRARGKEFNVEVLSVDPEHTDAVGIVKFAKDYLEREGIDLEYGDRGYCVFDSDPKSNPNIQQAFDLVAGAHDKGIRCIFSNPCFEVWFWLHMEDTAPHGLTAQQMKSRLKKALKPDFPRYSETTDIYEWLRDKREDARKRAERLHNSQKEVHQKVLSHECNPYTNMFQFLDYLDEVKSRRGK